MFSAYAPAAARMRVSKPVRTTLPPLSHVESAIPEDASPREWPPGEGEMARRIREFDWASTPLGPMHTWPQRHNKSFKPKPLRGRIGPDGVSGGSA